MKRTFNLITAMLLAVAIIAGSTACTKPDKQTMANTEAPTPSASATEGATETPNPTERPTLDLSWKWGSTEEPTDDYINTDPTPPRPTDAVPVDWKLKRVEVTFPVNENGMSYYLQDNPKVEPFTVSFLLPEGWTYQEDSNDHELYLLNWWGAEKPHHLFSPLWIYNEDGECMGAFGFNPMNELPEDCPQEEKHIIAYAGITTGSVYHIGLLDQYDVVSKPNAREETAITHAYIGVNAVSTYIDKNATNDPNGWDGEAYLNPAIGSFCEDIGMYVVFEFSHEVDGIYGLVRQLAESLRFE